MKDGRFLSGFQRLSPRAQSRLAIENDDRSFGLWSAVVEAARRTGRPVLWDILHHHCHDPDRVRDAEALRIALATWPRGVTPKIHFSSPRTATSTRRRQVGRRTSPRSSYRGRAHADMVDRIAFEAFLRGPAAGLGLDVMLEAKAKDVAVLRLREQLRARGFAL